MEAGSKIAHVISFVNRQDFNESSRVSLIGGQPEIAFYDPSVNELVQGEPSYTSHVLFSWAAGGSLDLQEYGAVILPGLLVPHSARILVPVAPPPVAVLRDPMIQIPTHFAHVAMKSFFHFTTVLTGCLLAACGSWIEAEEISEQDLKFFESKIRPVLVERCYSCHSAGADEIGGRLRLDSREGVLQGGESGPAIVANKPDESLLISALRYDGTEMPPEAPLSEAEINHFVEWIRRGAPDPRLAKKAEVAETPAFELSREEHWSFFPRSPGGLPAVKDPSWVLEPLDQFVLARLEEAQLQPTQEAEPRRKLRRLYYDLIGLPPTFDEIIAFENAVAADPRGAWSAQVDELLSRPQFGERWGRHWLDVARYGESNGDDGLGRNASFPQAWRYRDYVIEAFNNDVPYDQFLAEQIAGDLLPADSAEERNRQLVATGFLAIGAKPAAAMNNNFAMDVVDDQINVISTGVMGLSISCARCHDHKHDPITIQDYYALAGIFTSTETLYGRAADEGLTAPPTPLHELLAQWNVDEPEPVLLKETPQFPDDYGQKIDLPKPQIHESLRDKPEKLTAEGEVAFTPEVFARVDQSGLRGELPEPSTDYSVAFWFKNDMGNSDRPITAYLFSRGPAGDEKVGDHLGIGGTHEKERTGKLFLYNGSATKQSVAGNTVIPSGTWNHLVLVRKEDEVRLYLNGVPQPEFSGKVPSTLGESKTFVLATRTDKFAPLKGNVAEFALFDRAIATDEIQMLHGASGQPRGVVKPPPIGLAMGVRDRDKAADCKVHVDGETGKQAAVVARGFPQAFQSAGWDPEVQFGETGSGRLQLVNWITDPLHPQTARVMVNRVWMHLFGQAIVSTPNDFGVYGSRPTHPELLDYLAQRFVDEGWSVKQLIRHIVHSRTYQLDSVASDTLMQADPDNQLYGRHRRRRLDAESLRDSLLHAAGNLDLAPRQGSDVESTVALINWPPGASTNLHQESLHRSIYLCMLRHAPPPELAAFDLPDFVNVVGQRNESTLPTQSLFLLNSPIVIEQAETLANDLLEDDSENQTRPFIEGYRRVLQRDPTSEEVGRANVYVQSMQSQLMAAAVEEDQALRRAWASWCQALLASNEFRFVD